MVRNPRNFRKAIGAGLAAALLALSVSPAAAAGTLSGAELVRALRSGNYVILMRHASAPENPPSKDAVEPDNSLNERQLDQSGKDGARAMGAAWRKLNIPIGSAYSSPTYRARETARMAGFPDPVIVQELGDGGTSMSAGAVTGFAGWLKSAVARKPPAGTNALFITQSPNIVSAFPEAGKRLGNGGALIIQPEGNTARVVAQIAMAEWPALAR